ncbi:MAG: hypothetical protein JO266_02745, partial [Acidobacteria bacterium]|nr:hypothetical protein [Acidobacteriota bacterium]
MSVKLPDIDINAVTSLDEAKEIINQLLDILGQLQKELAELRQEVARLKQQPKKPHFSGQQNQSISATKLLEKKEKHWQKAKRRPIEIDQHVTLPEVATCVCGA